MVVEDPYSYIAHLTKKDYPLPSDFTSYENYVVELPMDNETRKLYLDTGIFPSYLIDLATDLEFDMVLESKRTETTDALNYLTINIATALKAFGGIDKIVEAAKTPGGQQLQTQMGRALGLLFSDNQIFAETSTVSQELQPYPDPSIKVSTLLHEILFIAQDCENLFVLEARHVRALELSYPFYEEDYDEEGVEYWNYILRTINIEELKKKRGELE